MNDSVYNNCTEHTTDMQSIWIACEMLSLLLTLMFLYFFLAVGKYMFMPIEKSLSRESSLKKMTGQKSTVRNSRYIRNLSFSQVENKNKIPESPTDISPGPSSNTFIGLDENRNRTNTVTIREPKSKKTGDGNKWLLRILFFCIFLAVLRCTEEQFLILFGSTSNLTCDILSKLMIILTAFCLHFCHVFLWLRQLTFYKNPILKPLRSKKLQILSYAAYIIMPITLIVTLTVYLMWRNHLVAEKMCRGEENTLYPQYVPFGILALSTVVIQILLSTLFLYPLVVHQRKRKKIRRSSAVEIQSNQSNKFESKFRRSFRRRSSDRLLSCITRVLIGATVGITTDVVGAIIGSFLPLSLPLFTLSVLYNCNIALNIICIIYTFANWREMILPCNKK